MMRFGLVGAGPWAQMTHAPAIAAAQGAELVGIWGRRQQAVRPLADLFKARAYDDLDALFADVDAVAFCVPPDVQAALALRAARAGKHVLLDKPMALTRTASDALADAVVAAGVRSIVFFTALFQPEIRSWLAELRTSDWDGATAHWLGTAFYEGSPWAAAAWRREKGGLWDIGPHVVAMLLSVLGPVDRVSAESGPRDTVSVLLHHRGGACSVATVSNDAPPAVDVNDLVIWGSRGRSWMPAGSLEPAAAFGVAVRELIDGGTTRETVCDAQFGRDVVDVIAQAAEALPGHPRT